MGARGPRGAPVFWLERFKRNRHGKSFTGRSSIPITIEKILPPVYFALRQHSQGKKRPASKFSEINQQFASSKTWPVQAT